MLIAVRLPAVARARPAAAPAGPVELTAWIRIDPDDTVIIAPPHMDTGQAVATSQTQLIADELDVDWNKVVIRVPEADKRYGWQFAGGSQTIALTWGPLRQAGATARAMLIQAAAGRWNVPAGECTTELGRVVHGASGRKLAYGLLAAAASKLPAPLSVALKGKTQWRYIGQPIRKRETPAVVVGKQIYGVDLQFPGMLVASIERPPTLGAKPRYDPARALEIAGVLKIIELPETPPPKTASRGGGMAGAPRGGVAVIARDTWAAFKGRDALAIEWNEPNAGESSDTIGKSLTDALTARGEEFDKTGDLDSALKAAPAVSIEAEYEMPFLAHMMMEPQSCVVQVKDGKATCWGPTQGPQEAAEEVAKLLNLKLTDVTFQPLPGGGGFGRRKGVAAVEAAMIAAQSDGAPVKVVWKREDETHFDQFRPVSRSRVRIVAERSGDLIGWDHHLASPWDQSNITMDSEGLGKAFFYEIPNSSFRHTTIQTAIEIGAMRGVNSVYNVFAVECAVDELAAAVGQDPFELRMRWLLKQPHFTKIEPPPPGTEGIIAPMQTSFPRMIAVLQACGKAVGWKHKPGQRRGMGLAIYTHLGTHCAVASEVSLTAKRTLKIHRIVAAVDMGTVVNPLGARAQIEGGLVMGLSETLRERITFNKGKAEQSTYSDYQIIRMPEVPAIDVVLVDSGALPTGAGEVAVPGVAPAVVNAVFAATGERIRKLPLFHVKPEFDPGM
jgi:isoquinoline 1-oxidoreductase subunit beta